MLKILQNASCIDFILTNSPYSFKNSCVIETGLSYFHKMTVTVMKTTYEKLKSIITNRDYKNFCNDKFWQIFWESLSKENINTYCSGLEHFLQIFINAWNLFTPCKKKKYSRGNIMLFMNKSLTSAYLKRKKFGNLYRENKTDSSSIACIMKRNYLTKTKKDHYMNFDEKDVTDNKQFWRTV